MLGKGDLQDTPALAILVPGLNFSSDKTGAGVKEWRRQIGPERVTAEISQMQVAPRD